MAHEPSKLNAYLDELRGLLRGLPEAEVGEIVAELCSHVRDSAGEAPAESVVAAALARLGTPAELAALYRTDRLLVRAERSRSPWLLLASLFRWATVSIAGSLVLLPVAVGYVAAASLFIAALIKPFAPERVGLWRIDRDEISLHLGLVEGPPPHGEELLGWWIVPLGLLVGAAAFGLAWWFGRWAIRRFRRDPLASNG
jgi:HAAS domain-containing protein